MGCKVIISPQAIDDLSSIVRYIAKDNPKAAVRVGYALIDRAAILEKFPLIGSLYRKRPGVRKLVLRPYVIFYRADPEQGRVDILRYWHPAQGEPHFVG
jgi:addiction module RelE/StbE family toxin